MHQTLILLLFLVSVYSAVHADSVRYARELRNSTESSRDPEHGKLKNSTGNLNSEKTKERSRSNTTLAEKLPNVSSQKLTGKHEKKLDKTKIPEQMKRVTERVNAVLRSTKNNRSLKERNSGKTIREGDPNGKTSRKLGANSTKHKVKPKRKLMRKLSTGSVLTDDDERTLVDETDEIGNQLTKGNKCGGGAELETCKDRILKKAVDVIPLSIPIDDTYSGVDAVNYGNVKIGLILAKNFDNCYDKNDKSDKFLECLKAGGEKSPLNVAYDEIARQLEGFCSREPSKEVDCRTNVVGLTKNWVMDSINAILVIFCQRKHKDPECSSPNANTPEEFSEEFDLLSKHKPIEMSTFKSSYDNVELGANLDKEAEKCKQEKSSDKFTECLEGVLKTSAVKKVVEEKIALSCKGNEEEQDCRDTGKKKVTTEINDVVNALLTNFCGKTKRKEQAFQSCLKTTLNKVQIAVIPPFLKIDFTKWTPLKDIVTEVEYGKIAVGSIVEGAVKNCENPKSFKNRNDFIKCLGSSESGPLKSAMDEISLQLTKHCPKPQLKERLCRKNGEIKIKSLLEKAIDQLILDYCESIGPKLQIDYNKCKRTSKASDLSNEFSLSFKLLDEIPLSNFHKKDENGEIKIGEIWKKGADSCKSHKTRDEYSTCLKGEPLKTTKNEIGQQLATQCGKVEREDVDDCRKKGKLELEARLKDAMDALLTNFCREFFSKPEKEYIECLDFDVDSLEPFSEMDNIPATIYAAIDISKLQTSSEHGEIKIGELLQNAANTCKEKKTINEYFDCVVGPKGSKSSPWIVAKDLVVIQLADLCGQKESIKGCRSTGRQDVQNKLKDAIEALLLNFCGENDGDSQQKYSSCIKSADQKKGTLSAVVLPISLRNEVSLPSLVISKYGDIRIGEIIQKQAGMCKNMKKLDEVVDCLKTSKGVEPSPAKAARDSISDKFADYALMKKFGDDDWKQGVEEVRKEFKNAIQALISNFCRDNVNNDQFSYEDCLDEGLINSEPFSNLTTVAQFNTSGYTPTDVFLQCSLKTIESDFNQCIDTVTSQRLSSWTASCATNPSKETECTDAAKKSTAESSKVSKLSARLVACKDASCIQSEKQKVIDAFTKEEEKYCKTPCKDSKARVESAVEKSFCSIDPANLKCQAFSCPTVFEDTPCQNDGEVFKKCRNTCNQVEQSKLEKKKDGGPNYGLIGGIIAGSILLLIGAFFGVWCWCKKGKNNEEPEKMKNKKKKKKKKSKPSADKDDSIVVPPPPLPRLRDESDTDASNTDTPSAIKPKKDSLETPKKDSLETPKKDTLETPKKANTKESQDEENSVREDEDDGGNPDQESKNLIKKKKLKQKKRQEKKERSKQHIQKRSREHQDDLNRKFKNTGPIKIDEDPKVPPAEPQPTNDAELNRVAWDDELNQYKPVGSKIDLIIPNPDNSVSQSVDNSESQEASTLASTPAATASAAPNSVPGQAPTATVTQNAAPSSTPATTSAPDSNETNNQASNAVLASNPAQSQAPAFTQPPTFAQSNQDPNPTQKK